MDRDFRIDHPDVFHADMSIHVEKYNYLDVWMRYGCSFFSRKRVSTSKPETKEDFEALLYMESSLSASDRFIKSDGRALLNAGHLFIRSSGRQVELTCSTSIEGKSETKTFHSMLKNDYFLINLPADILRDEPRDVQVYCSVMSGDAGIHYHEYVHLLSNRDYRLDCLDSEIRQAMNQGVQRPSSKKKVHLVSVRSEDKIVSSIREICNELSRLSIVYDESSVSSEPGYQKISYPNEVISRHRGSCLDLSILLCNRFLLAGLEPIVFKYHGHAMAGVILETDLRDIGFRLKPSAESEALTLEFDRGTVRAIVLESTAFCSGRSYQDQFSQSVAIGLNNLKALAKTGMPLEYTLS